MGILLAQHTRQTYQFNQHGFSLLEVMLVLVIGGLLMGVMVTSFSEGPVLRKSTREIISSLRHARALAIMRQESTLWTLDVQKKAFSIGDRNGETRTLPSSVEVKINTAASEVKGPNQGSIRFFPDGSSTGGSVEVSAKGQAFKVNVEWISGRISSQ